MLVISAHPGDLLWRCSGSVAKHTKNGGEVQVIILTYGTGGEANDLMTTGMDIETAKKVRKRDTTKVAEILGVNQIDFWDLQDYPLEMDRDSLKKLAAYYRNYQPDFILTHHNKDILNPDHGSVLNYVILAAELAGGYGIEIEGTTPGLKRTPIFCFEPHASEFNNFQPNVFVDISEVIDLKKQAMSCFEGKAKLAESYEKRAEIRASNASSFGRRGCQYAEAYQAVYPFAMSGDFVF